MKKPVFSNCEQDYGDFHENMLVILSYVGKRLEYKAEYLNKTALDCYSKSVNDPDASRYNDASNFIEATYYNNCIGFTTQSMAAVCLAGARIISEHVQRS